MFNLKSVIFSVVIIVIVVVVFMRVSTISPVKGRWYTQHMVNKGALLFQQNCATCHGANAEGTLEWKKTDSHGNYPPPPLNGTAHTWHHNIGMLKKTVREGGARLGGTMPPFSGVLSDLDIEAVIAYFQSKWPDEVYQFWQDRNL